MSDSAAQRRRSAWRLVLPLFVIGGVACWLLFASPPLEKMFRELQACPASEITEVRIYDFDPGYSDSAPALILRGNNAANFMGSVSKAEKVNPNHPRGGSTLFAEVDTAKWGTRHLRVSATDNCGVLIYIDSKKVGRDSHWSDGPWRNDDLISVFSDFAAVARKARGSG
jgi:hypothetical protein